MSSFSRFAGQPTGRIPTASLPGHRGPFGTDGALLQSAPTPRTRSRAAYPVLVGIADRSPRRGSRPALGARAPIARPSCASLPSRAAVPRARITSLLATTLCIFLLVATSVASAAAPARDAVDASSASDVERGLLRVSVASEIVDASLISGWIVERNERIHEQVPTFEGHEQWIAVNVMGVTYDYRVTVIPMRDGIVVGSSQPPAVCACNSAKLLGLVDGRIAQAIEQLQTAPLEPESALVMPPPRPDASRSTTPEPEPEPPPPPPKRRRLSGLGIAGAVLTGMGGSAVAGGIVMTVLGSRSMPNSTGFRMDWRPPGVVVLAAGGAVLTAGVSLLVTDAVRCRKSDAPRRCRRHTEGFAVGPSLDAGGGGVTLVGRF